MRKGVGLTTQRGETASSIRTKVEMNVDGKEGTRR